MLHVDLSIIRKIMTTYSKSVKDMKDYLRTSIKTNRLYLAGEIIESLNIGELDEEFCYE